MKKFLFSTFLLFAVFLAGAQNQRTLQQVTSLLENADIFIEYRHFRDDFQTLTRDIGKSLTDVEDYNKLKITYEHFQNRYNHFLGRIRSNLSDKDTIRQMVRNPSQFIEGYAADYRKVMLWHEQRCAPVYEELAAKARLDKDKSIPTLADFARMAFSWLVETIRDRKVEKEEVRNLVLGMVNQYFYEKLRMKNWSELAIAPPAPKPAPATEPAPDAEASNSEAPNSAATTAETSAAPTRQTPPPPVVNTTPPIEYPVFEELSGWVEFILKNPDGTEQRMDFKENRGKDLEIEEFEVGEDGKLGSQTVSSRVTFYESKTAYPEGARFTLKTGNSAGTYVFALNSYGSVVCLYGEKSKDIVTDDEPELPFVDGQNEERVNVFPTFKITKSADASPKENFCLLLTRSQINTEDTRRRLEQETGPLDERVAKVFGSSLIRPEEGQLSLTNNRLVFQAQNKDRHVLPVVFYILRK